MFVSADKIRVSLEKENSDFSPSEVASLHTHKGKTEELQYWAIANHGKRSGGGEGGRKPSAESSTLLRGGARGIFTWEILKISLAETYFLDLNFI